MRKVLTAAILVGAVSLGSIAVAQVKPLGPDGQYEPSLATQQTMTVDPAMSMPADQSAQDARMIASDQEVGEARRAYRAACDRVESTGFCECVTAGVAQALHPSEVRIAARTSATASRRKAMRRWRQKPTAPLGCRVQRRASSRSKRIMPTPARNSAANLRRPPPQQSHPRPPARARGLRSPPGRL